MKNTISNIQNDIWLDQALIPESPKYNIGGYAIIDGPIDFELFRTAFQVLINENDIFSFDFTNTHGIVTYMLKDRKTMEILSYFEEDTVESAITKIEENFTVPFSLVNENPLFESWLVKISEAKYIWYTKLHHIIADGFSFHLLFNETDRIYRELMIDSSYGILEPGKLNNLYPNFIREEQKHRASNEYIDSKKFWLKRYTELPKLIYTELNAKNGHCNLEINLSKEENKTLQDVAKEHGLSVYHVLLNVFALILFKYYKTNEVNFGIPTANRKNLLEKNTLGPFVSILPLKLIMNENISFLKSIRNTKKELFSSYRHRKFQQGDILRELPHHVHRLYDVRLSYEKLHYKSTFTGNIASIHPISNTSETDPIAIYATEHQEGELQFRFDVNQNYVPKLEAEQLIKSFEFLLLNIKTILNDALNEIGITTKDQLTEVQKVSIGTQKTRINETFLDVWNNTYLLNNKKSIAVTNKKTHLSYKELNDKALKLAFFLKNVGIKKGNRVAVMFPRSEKSIICILALFKIGAVYVPIDSTYPNKRKEFILRDSDSKYILVDSFSDSIFHYMEFNIDEILEEEYTSQENTVLKAPTKEDIAYILYTSGSTGTPNGVMVRHESLYDYIMTFIAYFNLNPNDKVVQQTSLSFDTSIEEIFPILAVGGNLIVVEENKDFHRLLKQCETHGVTLLSTNPFVVQYLNENSSKYNLKLRTLISGGDRLKSFQVNKLVDRFAVYNTYGPTESTVCATYHKVAITDEIIPLGKPIANRTVYILDNEKILPKGAIGEIGLSGKGLAKEYINQVELTKEKFVTIAEERVFKTGDIGKWSENGQLIFYGRKDDHLNFNGYRIAVGEVENAIKELDAYVLDCYVCIEEVDHTSMLIAYVVADENFVNVLDLSRGLKESLPEHMIPTHLALIEVIPLLPSGKINVNQLPKPNKHNVSQNLVSLPVTNEEKEIASIWRELLKIDHIDVNVSFFELGGHSLLANQFISSLREKKGVELSLKEFYESPTIKEIGNLFSSMDKSNMKLTTAPIADAYPLSYSQERLWYLNKLDVFDTSYHISRAIQLNGNIDIKLLSKTITKLIAKHEILRTVFVTMEGMPFQKILPPYEYSIAAIPFGLTRNTKEKAVKEAIMKLEEQPFDLENGPLFRAKLLKLNPQEHVLIFCEHHMILDGWTQTILFRDFVDVYNELTKNPDFEVAEPKVKFKDYAYWQKQYLKGEKLEKQLNFWEEKLKGSKSILPLPLDGLRADIPVRNEGVLEHTFSLETSQKIRRFSEKNNVSLFMTMLTVFKIVLSKLSGEHDICIGTAVANRQYKQFAQVLGMMVNTIVLRTSFDKELMLSEVLEKVRETCIEAYTYEDTPFDLVEDRVKQEKNVKNQSLFQYMFNFVDMPVKNMSTLDAEIEILRINNGTSKMDINVLVNTTSEQPDITFGDEVEKRIFIEWEYNSNIFSKSTMEMMLACYLKILDVLLKGTVLSVEALDLVLIGEKEMHNIKQTYNDNMEYELEDSMQLKSDRASQVLK